jgi:hypothetical protein
MHFQAKNNFYHNPEQVLSVNPPEPFPHPHKNF